MYSCTGMFERARQIIGAVNVSTGILHVLYNYMYYIYTFDGFVANSVCVDLEVGGLMIFNWLSI